MEEEKVKASSQVEKNDKYPSTPPRPAIPAPQRAGGDEEDQQHPQKVRPCCTSVAAISCLFGIFLILASLAVLLAVSLTCSLHDPTITLASARVLTPSPLPAAASHTSLGLDLLVCNPNGAAPFDHGPGTTLLRYRGLPLGSVEAGAGRVPAKGCEHVRCELALDGLFEAAGGPAGLRRRPGGLLGMIIQDAARHDGEVPFDAHTRIQGTVRVLGMFRRKAVAAGTCHVVMKFSVAGIGIIRYTCSPAQEAWR